MITDVLVIQRGIKYVGVERNILQGTCRALGQEMVVGKSPLGNLSEKGCRKSCRQ